MAKLTVFEAEKFLDWMVKLEISFYTTQATAFYAPTSKSHFYLAGSPERFSSKELVDIWLNKTTDALNARWLEALAQHHEHQRNIE